MNNPHVKEDYFKYELGTPSYHSDYWHESAIEVEVGGLGLIICTLCASNANSVNVGFRIVNENDVPLPPYRIKTGNRHPTHFTFEPHPHTSSERMSIITFHIIANCLRAKLQFRPSDSIQSNPGYFELNDFVIGNVDAAWCHKPISTMTAIPLIPIYQPGVNTVFTYPQSRMSRSTEDEKDKTPLKSSQTKHRITSSP